MARRTHEAPQDGFTLIEVLISVAIIGIAFIALIGAMTTALSAAKFHRTQAISGTTVVSAAELVKTAPYDATCPAGASYPSYLNAAEGAAVPSDWIKQGFTAADAINIDSVEYWDGSTGFGATCHDKDPDDTQHFLRVQMITLIVRGPSDSPTSRCIFDSSGNLTDPRCAVVIKRGA